MVEPQLVGPIGAAAGRTPVRSARSALEKPPWKNLPSLEGVIEDEFLRPVHLGSTIVAFRARETAVGVVPWHDNQLLEGQGAALDEFAGLADYWRAAERVWNENRSEASTLSLGEQINFQGKLAQQFPIAPQRVVYTKSGTHIAACRVSDPSAVVDHTLYWAAMSSVAEAQYLCGVLNSQALSDAVAPLQAVGAFGARHFDLYVFALPFPAFDSRVGLHAAVANLAARAEQVAAGVDLDPSWQFQKCRRITRAVLHEDGIAGEIDAAVAELLELGNASGSVSLGVIRRDRTAN